MQMEDVFFLIMKQRVFLLVLVSLFGILSEVDSNCELSLHKDFGTPSPVFLQNGVFLAPNFKGGLSFRRAAKLTVACPGNTRYVVLGNDTTNMQDLEIQCVTNTTFKTGRWQGDFKEIRCNGQPWFSAEDVEACSGGNRLYKVGYKIKNIFHPVYEACFNKDLLSTLYVKHYLTPVSRFNQAGGRRPSFIEGDLFGKVRMSELYKAKNQKARLNELLGGGLDKEFITKKQFLTRGHLAPRGDFIMSGVQRASFHYVNTAPQWMRNNAGDWAALEDALRRRAQTLNTTLTIYTGTFGVLLMKNSRGEDLEFHLTSDANNNQIVPVPMYFYKVAYNPHRKTATAFITINSSFYNSTVTEKLTFCSDICDGNQNYSWLRWRADGAHSFCCDYNEFVEKINYLPRLDVKGQFY